MISTFSYSSLNDYFTCPKMFWYRTYNKKRGVPNEYIIKGNSIHHAVEKCNNLGCAIEYLTHYYDNESFISREIPSDVSRCVENFYTIIYPHLKETDLIEKSFRIPFYDTGLLLLGKMDRINVQDNVIYDWKSTTQAPDRYDLQDMQFYIYWMAYNQLYGEKPRVFYGHLYSGQIFPIDIRENLWYNDIIGLIKETLSEIKSKDKDGFYPRIFGYRCKNCLYKGVCWQEYELGN